MRFFLGLVLLLIPCSLGFAVMAYQIGFLLAVGVVVASIALTAMIVGGVWLLLP